MSNMAIEEEDKHIQPNKVKGWAQEMLDDSVCTDEEYLKAILLGFLTELEVNNKLVKAFEWEGAYYFPDLAATDGLRKFTI